MITQDDIDAMDDRVESDFFTHSDKDSSGESFRDAMDEAGRAYTDKQEDNACYAGYEVVYSGYWLNSDYWATHVNGVAMVKPVKL